jgi:hypothetical protein
METANPALIVLANVAVIVVLVGLAHFVGWAGPSYAAGFLSGASVFFTYFRLKHGYWP